MLLIAFSKPSHSCTSSMKRRLRAPPLVPLYDFAMQRVVLEQRLVVEVQQIDIDVVGGWVPPSNGGGERLHELGLAGAAHSRDHLVSRAPSNAQSRSMYVLRSTQAIISSISVSKLEFF